MQARRGLLIARFFSPSMNRSNKSRNLPTRWLSYAAGRFRHKLIVLAGILSLVFPGMAQAASCFPAPTNIIGWWPGDGSAADITGTNNGVLLGGATASATGVVGSAFSFDGTNNFVAVSNSA